LTATSLQCRTALFSWKIVFESDQKLFEVIPSVRSATEEEQWKLFMERRREISDSKGTRVHPASTEPFTAVTSALKLVGVAFGQAGTLARRLFVQRAATVGNRTNMYRVIIRNTHKPQDSRDNRDSRGPSAASISRSESLLTTHKSYPYAKKERTNPAGVCLGRHLDAG
jgi:hypothetical protein